MWYCHECHAEMRPLMVPDPHCASCNGTFVEKIENANDDPREFHHAHDGFEDDALPADMDGFLTGLRTLLRGAGPHPGADTVPTPGAQRAQSEGPTGRPDRMDLGEGTGMTIRIQGSPDGRSRTMIIGGSSRTGGRGDNLPPLFSEFMTRGPGMTRGQDMPGAQDARQDRATIAGPLMAQYLLAMLGSRPGRGNDSFNDMFGGMFGMPEGAENGRWGDYVFNQEALDQIITQMMENSNSTAPVPATEEIMDNLPRTVLEDGSDLLERDCAVCKEQFKLGTEDPDEQIVVTLPCKHPFHEPCIMPWLKSSGTCPVCRYQLIPQPEHHAPGPGPPGGSETRPPNRSPSPENSRRSPSGGGRSSIFNSIFSSFSGNNGNQNSQGTSRRRGSGDSGRARRGSTDAHIPGAWDRVD